MGKNGKEQSIERGSKEPQKAGFIHCIPNKKQEVLIEQQEERGMRGRNVVIWN